MAGDIRAANPFANSGLDKRLVEALVNSADPEALEIVLTGLRRAVTKALHPDKGLVAPVGTEYFDMFLQATNQLTGLPASQLNVLGRAYAKSKRTTAPRPQPVTYESKDLHDGSILTSIIDMVSDTGESITTSRNSRFVVRPLSYHESRPKDAPDDGPFTWYPPESMRVPIINVDAHGTVTWQVSRQASLHKLLHKHIGRSATNAEYADYRTQMSGEFTQLLLPLTASLQPNSANDALIITKNGTTLTLSQSISKKILGTIEDKEGRLRGVHDGIYTMDFSAKTTTRLLHDSCFLTEDDTEHASPLLIVGSTDKEYMQKERQRIYANDNPFVGRPALRSNGDAVKRLPYFQVPRNMYRYVQSSYTPQIHSGRQLLATDGVELYILGDVVFATNSI